MRDFEIFYRFYYFGRTVVLGSTYCLTETSTRDLFLLRRPGAEGKAYQGLGMETWSPSCADCLKMGIAYEILAEKPES
jgi:hypothetical protein